MEVEQLADPAQVEAEAELAPLVPGEVTLSGGSGNFTRVGLTMTAATAQSILDNPAGFYFNVHTAANPGGVMRGQLVKQ